MFGLVCILIMFCQEVYRLVGDFFPKYGFFYNPFNNTFTTDPRVIGSIAGSAPVEHPHCSAKINKNLLGVFCKLQLRVLLPDLTLLCRYNQQAVTENEQTIFFAESATNDMK